MYSRLLWINLICLATVDSFVNIFMPLTCQTITLFTYLLWSSHKWVWTQVYLISYILRTLLHGWNLFRLKINEKVISIITIINSVHIHYGNFTLLFKITFLTILRSSAHDERLLKGFTSSQRLIWNKSNEQGKIKLQKIYAGLSFNITDGLKRDLKETTT